MPVGRYSIICLGPASAADVDKTIRNTAATGER
jgi:hypothetical protein